jgi:hypothetical protein
MAYVRLIYDPQKETAEAFEVRMAEAIAATGKPEEEVTVVVHEVVHCPKPTVDYCGNA